MMPQRCGILAAIIAGALTCIAAGPTAAPFQTGAAVYAYGGPATAAVSFDAAVGTSTAEDPSNNPPTAANPLQFGSYVPTLQRQLQASLRAGSFSGSGTLYRGQSDGRDSFHSDTDQAMADANAAAAGHVQLNIGADARRVDVLSLDDTPFGQWLTQSQADAADGPVSSFYTDLAGDIIGARRVANPRTIVVVPDVRGPVDDDSEPAAYTLPEAVSLDAPSGRPTLGMSTVLTSSTPIVSPMFQTRYSGPAPKRDSDGGTEILAGEGVEARPIGFLQRMFKWGQANPILAGLIAGVFAVVMGTIVARNPGQADKPN